MRLNAHGRSARFWSGSKRLLVRKMTADERSLAIGACRLCASETKTAHVYCLSCATTQADRDARHFDHWLVVYAVSAAVMTAMYAAYLLAKNLGLLT